MKRLIALTKSKLAMVALVTSACMAVLVGSTTAAVMASIPDSGGVIHGCYKTASGVLRLTDNTSKKCGPKEAAISWNQQGLQGPQGPQGFQGPPGTSSGPDTGQNSGQNDNLTAAYAHIMGGPSSGVWDTTRSKNISAMAFSYDSQQGRRAACITVSFEPESISVTGGAASPDLVGIRNTGLNPENDGWSDAYANQVCGTTGNAFVAGYGSSTFVSFTR